MHTSRRNFLRTTTFTLVGSTVLSNELIAEVFKKRKVTGVQLFSVRNDMTKDPKGTLKQLSDMGFRYVEHANYVGRKFYGFTATEFKKILGDLNLKMPSGHTVLSKQHWDDTKKDFTDAWKYTVEDAATVGQQIVISP